MTKNTNLTASYYTYLCHCFSINRSSC